MRYFAGLGRGFEWKYYGYDQPADLPNRLRRAGLVAGQQEALMVAEVGEIAESRPPAAS